jgi:hypothetical protein
MPKLNPAESADNRLAVENEMLKRQVTEISNEFENMSLRVEEGLTQLSLMADNRGWLDMSGYMEDGPDLHQVQDVSKKLKNLTGLNAHMGRGARLRHSYVWAGGIHHDDIPAGGGRGTTNVEAMVKHPHNQRAFFGAAARERQEKALYTTGHYLVVGEDVPVDRRRSMGTSKLLHNVPLYQISAYIVDPNDPTEVWAIRRSWSEDGIVTTIDPRMPNGNLKHEWIFDDAHKDKETATVKYNGGTERVNRNKRYFLQVVNRQDGWCWGLPDAVAAFNWADQYRKGVLNGLKMQEALATLAFKIKSASAAGAKSAATKTAGTTQKGATAAMPEGTDVAALSSAGSGYDFDSLRPVLAIVATALDVSVVALSSDPGAAGSSYGSAQTLDKPTVLSTMARRALHVEFEKRILNWLGAPDARVWFEILDDGAELYRRIQAIALLWQSGVYEAEDIKAAFEELLGHGEIDASVPDGVLIPNNANSLARRDLDTDANGVATTTPAADQGVSNNVGGQGGDSGTDIRTDTLS